MEDSEKSKECGIGFCRRRIRARRSVCEGCMERHSREQAWFAEMEENRMLWQIAKELRAAEEAGSRTRKGDVNGSK